MCNIVHTCIKKYTVAVLYSCKFCTARVFLFLADHEAIQFTNILKLGSSLERALFGHLRFRFLKKR